MLGGQDGMKTDRQVIELQDHASESDAHRLRLQSSEGGVT